MDETIHEATVCFLFSTGEKAFGYILEVFHCFYLFEVDDGIVSYFVRNGWLDELDEAIDIY